MEVKLGFGWNKDAGILNKAHCENGAGVKLGFNIKIVGVKLDSMWNWVWVKSGLNIGKVGNPN